MTAPHSLPRHTQNYLRSLFGAHGIHPKAKLGQNFLIDLNLLDLIVRSAELSRDDLVVEVGSGTGSLTLRLSEHAGMVLSVELDPHFYELASEATAGRPNARLMHADILHGKNVLNPQVLAALGEMRQQC